MNINLSAPTNFKVKAGNKYSHSSWDPVPNADGYRIDYYLASNTEKRIKYRFAQSTQKRILGFKNGVEYCACVCAFQYVNEKEDFGPKSELVYFTPISTSLTSSNVVCLKTGDTAQLSWEFRNKKPEINIDVLDSSIAQVDESGLIKAVSTGETYVSLSLKNPEDISVATKDTFCVHICVDRDLTNSYEVSPNKDYVDIMLTGDIMCSVWTQLSCKKNSYDFTDIFSKRLVEKFNEADFVIGNLETMCYDSKPFESEEYRLPTGSANNNSPSTFLSTLKAVGFDGLVTANNHNADCGMEGLAYTISKIQDNGMTNIGALSCNPVYFEKNGIKIAIIALSMVNNGIDYFFENPGSELARYSETKYLEYIQAAKSQNCDRIIVCMHWGRMNSTSVSTVQKNTASFLAENGADIIVGSEPHVLQKMDMIRTSSGKQVPCFYSLGNFYSSMREMFENTVAGIVNVRFYTNDSSNESYPPQISFIPTVCIKQEDASSIVDLANPIISDVHQKAAEYTQNLFDNKLSATKTLIKYPLALQGSVFLNDVKKYLEFPTFDDGLIISPLTIFDNKLEANSVYKKNNNNLGIDLSKSYIDSIKESNAEFFCFDLYAAVAISIFEHSANGQTTHYTGTKRFLRSNFYRDNANELIEIAPFQDFELTRKLLDKYINTLLSLYSHEKIIFIRISIPNMGCKQGELRNSTNNDALNNALHEMEEYVINKVHPCVIDISKFYFKDLEAKSNNTFEASFYEHCASCITEYISKPYAKIHYHTQDNKIWIRRIAKYYKNMTARSYQRYLLNTVDAADIIIANSSYLFVSKYQDALIEIKESKIHLNFIADMYSKKYPEVAKAALAIEGMLSKDLTKSYTDYSVAFDYNFNILKAFSKTVSQYIGEHVGPDNISYVYKIINDKEKLSEYFSHHPVTHLDIWGSCISRELVNRANSKLCVENYIFKQSQLLSDKAPADNINFTNNVADYGNNTWRMRTIQDAFMRKGRNQLAQNHSKYILIDFYDLICTMKNYNGELFEVDDFIVRTAFYQRIKKECYTTYLYKEFDSDTSIEKIKDFANFIKKIYGKNIVFVIADLKCNYLDLYGEVKPLNDDGSYSYKVEYIQMLEKVFINETNCHVIDASTRYMASDKFPLGGAHIVHYESEFYDEACNKLLRIIESTKTE